MQFALENIVEGSTTFFIYPKAKVDYNAIDKKTGKTLLISLVEEKNIEKVKEYIAMENIDVNKADNKDGFTPLLCAVDKGCIETTRLLLQHPKIDVNKCLKNGKNKGASPLLLSVTNHQNIDVEMVKLLLTHPNIDVNKSGNENLETPLFCAASLNNTEIVNLLCEQVNVNINKVDKYNSTPLLAASRNGCVETVEYLLKTNLSNIKPALEKEDCYGYTPLSRSKTFGYTKIEEMLKNSGATK